jgi:hypothetical protein
MSRREIVTLSILIGADQDNVWSALTSAKDHYRLVLLALFVTHSILAAGGQTEP